MNAKHRLVVSAENGAYHAWQCKLFYFSSVTRLDHQPIFIVHANGRPWHPGFYDLVRAGAILRPARSYIGTNGIPSRNCVGSLLEAASILESNELIVLCDPDMVFASRPELPSCLAACHYDYLSCERPSIYAAARHMRLPKTLLRGQKHVLLCGTPYIVPAALATEIGNAWLRAFDCFPLTERGPEDNVWLDLMFAFGLAVLKLKLELQIFDVVNLDSPAGCKLSRNIVHYGMGSRSWDKRSYRTEEAIARVWEPPFVPIKGTVLAELFTQMRAVPKFYSSTYNL